MIFVLQSGRNRHEHICECIELFAPEVLPRFAENRAEHEQAKAERLAAATVPGAGPAACLLGPPPRTG